MKCKIEKNTVQETLILPLYSRKLCTELYPNLYRDETAARLLDQIDYDFSEAEKNSRSLMQRFGALEVAMRQGDLAFEVRDYLKGHPDIHFNLSHCPKAALCAIAGVPVGADIESIRPYNPQLARRVLSEAEVEQVESSPSPDIVFARLWTMKESLLKLTGEGIRRDLKSVLVNTSARFATTINTARGYVFTVCTEQ